MSSAHDPDVGVLLEHGCCITRGLSANVKQPFPDMPDLIMHELYPGGGSKPFSGQLGFIECTTDIRLPRHIHMEPAKERPISGRVLVLNGVRIVELAGDVFVVTSGSLVEAVGSVPHTWFACPEGVKLSDWTVSEGRLTMMYEYEGCTSFFATASTEVVSNVKDYDKFEGDFEEIRFPKLTAQDVVSGLRLSLASIRKMSNWPDVSRSRHAYGITKVDSHLSFNDFQVLDFNFDLEHRLLRDTWTDATSTSEG